MVAAVKAGDRAPGRAVPGLAGNRDRQRRVDGGDVADNARLHLHDALALAGVRDLQDPAPPVVGGEPEVLVALADERGGRRTNAEDVGGDDGSFLEAEPRRGRPEDVAVGGPCGLHWHVAFLWHGGALHGVDGTGRLAVGRPRPRALAAPEARLDSAVARDGGTADALDSKSSDRKVMGVRISLPGPRLVGGGRACGGDGPGSAPGAPLSSEDGTRTGRPGASIRGLAVGLPGAPRPSFLCEGRMPGRARPVRGHGFQCPRGRRMRPRIRHHPMAARQGTVRSSLRRSSLVPRQWRRTSPP